jgi:hypothetical protein
VLFVVALIMFIRMISSSTSSTPAVAASTPAPIAPQPRATTRRTTRGKSKTDKSSGPATPSLDPRLRLSDLKEAEETTYDGTGRNIFVATEEPKQPIPTPISPGITNPGPVAVTPPTVRQRPPINLKFFGFASGPDHKRVFLSQGDDVMVAAEGDIVERRYKIVKINNNNIEVLDVLSNDHQMIPLTAG